MSIILNRNAEVYVSNVTTDTSPGPSANDTDKISITKAYSLEHRVNTAKVDRSTLNPTESRAQTVYSESADTVDFSLETYLYAGNIASNIELVHRRLFAGLAGYLSSVTSYVNRSEVLFTNSDIPQLLENTIWFAYPNMTYRVDNAVINSATINLDLNDIAKITWKGSGLGLNTTQSYSPPAAADLSTYRSCIRHKLTDITLQISAPGGGSYSANLLNCDITINNNPTFVRREKLGTFSTYTTHYTGDREVSGTLNFYLKTIGGGQATADLFDDLYTNKNYLEDFTADITISVGGTSQLPRFELIMPKVYLDLPNFDFTEVLSIAVPFIALETSAGAADELTMKYYL